MPHVKRRAKVFGPSHQTKTGRLAGGAQQTAGHRVGLFVLDADPHASIVGAGRSWPARKHDVEEQLSGIEEMATAGNALALAGQLQPFAMTLDLMMPGRDGWDLMQIPLNQPGTSSIPIIVCTVLKQKELALSLGAAAFLEKLFSQQTLLSTLNALVDQ